MKEYSLTSWSVKCGERDVTGHCIINEVHLSRYSAAKKQPGGILRAIYKFYACQFSA